MTIVEYRRQTTMPLRLLRSSKRAARVLAVALAVSSLGCGLARAVDGEVKPTNDFPDPYRAE
jgi:hypothetical protein